MKGLLLCKNRNQQQQINLKPHSTPYQRRNKNMTKYIAHDKDGNPFRSPIFVGA